MHSASLLTNLPGISRHGPFLKQRIICQRSQQMGRQRAGMKLVPPELQLL